MHTHLHEMVMMMYTDSMQKLLLADSRFTAVCAWLCTHSRLVVYCTATHSRLVVYWDGNTLQIGSADQTSCVLHGRLLVV